MRSHDMHGQLADVGEAEPAHLDERDLAGDEELVAHDIGVSVAGRWGQAGGLLIGVRGRQPVMRDPSIARR